MLRKGISILLAFLLVFQNGLITFAATTSSSQPLTEDIMINSSETWSGSKVIDQNVWIGPNATLTIENGSEITLNGDLIIYGSVANHGSINMNRHDIYANYVNMGGMQMWGDQSLQSIGIFEPYGRTTNVGSLIVRGMAYYPAPPLTITSPINGATVTDAALSVEGKTIAGFEVTIKDQKAVADQAGNFKIPVTLQEDSQTLSIKVTDSFNQKSESQELSITYERDSTPPAKPTVQPVGDNDTTVKGKAEPNSSIKVVKSGTAIGSGTTDANGNFTISINKQSTGTSLVVTATDKSGNISEATKVVVFDNTPPQAPLAKPFGNNDTVLKGTAEIITTIKVIKNNIMIGSGQTDANGVFSVSLDKQTVGTTLVITATDEAGNTSKETKVVVNDSTPPAKPTVQPVGDNDTTVKGKAEPNSSIKVVKNGTAIGSGTTDANGNFTVSISKQPTETTLVITATDQSGNTSSATNVIVNDNSGPKVSATTPVSNATEVPINSSVKVVFNEEIKSGTAYNNIQVLSGNNEEIAITKSVTGKELILKPVEKLKSTQKYTIIIPANSVVDKSGNSLASKYEYSFKTEDTSTKISGGIYQDTTLKKENSPYLVTNDLTVFPDATLKVEPGVVVKFANGKGITLRGKLEALGTAQDKIQFTSSEQQTKSDWNGINADVNQGANIKLVHTTISNANTGIKIECCDNYQPYEDFVIDSTKFYMNNVGIKGEMSPPVKIHITNGVFEKNTYGMTGELKTQIEKTTFKNNDYAFSNNAGTPGSITESQFIGNKNALYNVNDLDIYHNEFLNNDLALYPNTGNVKFNKIENNRVGIELNYSRNLTIENNMIANNDLGFDVKGSLGAKIKKNNILNNNLNIKNGSSSNIDLSNNWWGTKDESQIKKKMFDGYDDASLGLVVFKPVLLEQAVVKDVTAPIWPSASQLKAANITETSLTLNWPAATDNVEVAEYRIKKDGAIIGTVPANTRSFEVQGLGTKAEYVFSVEAVDESGNWTNQPLSSLIVVKDIIAPTWPESSKLTVTKVGERSVKVTWPNATDKFGIKEYIIKKNGQQVTTVPKTTTTYTIDKLAFGSDYLISVEAVDLSGNKSKPLESTKVSITDTQQPVWTGTSDFSILKLERNIVSFSWDYEAHVDKLVDNDKIKELKCYQGTQFISKSTDGFCEAKNLKPGHEYTFKLEAVDMSGNESTTGPKLTVKTPGSNAERISSSNRYSTAVEISKTGWNQADTVVIARGDSFPDALAGAPLGYKLDAPILLTDKNNLTEETKKEITRLKAKKAVILGGVGAISTNVEQQLKKSGLTVTRLGGSNRFETAAKIAEYMGDKPKGVILAYGYNFPDALAIAPFAARNGYPILLTDKETMPQQTSKLVKQYGNIPVIAVGGKNAISNKVIEQINSAKVQRISGSDRFETASQILQFSKFPTNNVFVANGMNFADALTGSVLAAKKNAPLLLVEPNRMPAGTMKTIQTHKLTNFTVLGGSVAVGKEVMSVLQK